MKRLSQVRGRKYGRDINSGKTGSASVAIMDNGKIVYAESFGMADREASIPVDADTRFNIGSISTEFPFPFEVPYSTYFPITKNPEWVSAGGVKLADLCQFESTNNNWYWYEFKGCQCRERLKYPKYPFISFTNDIVALAGFDADRTASMWQNPRNGIKDYRFESLKSHIGQLQCGTHHFRAACIEVCNQFDQELWSEENLFKKIQQTIVDMQKQCGQKTVKPLTDISLTNYQLYSKDSKSIWLIMAEW